MKMQLIRKAVWVVDLALVIILIVTAAGVLGSPAAPVALDEGLADGDGGSAQVLAPLTNEQASAIVESGSIVPVPARPAAAAPTVVERPAVQQADLASSFRYKLIGTVVGAGCDCAIFQDKSGGRQVYRALGEEIDGVEVTAVYDDRVEIRKGGQTGTVYREKPQRLAGFAPPPALPDIRPTYAPQVPTMPEVAEVVEGDEEGYDGEDEFWQDPDQMIMTEDQYRNYLQNISTYINQVTIQSHRNSVNEVDGLLLAAVPQESEAYKRGLREGDIVTHIQGEPVADTQMALKIAWDILKNEEYIVDIGIIRNGQEEILTYEIWPE